MHQSYRPAAHIEFEGNGEGPLLWPPVAALAESKTPSSPLAEPFIKTAIIQQLVMEIYRWCAPFHNNKTVWLSSISLVIFLWV